MPSDDLAEQALANLVNQFARSMDFLRELVQNSMDAGTPRIEVRIDYVESSGNRRGVLEASVRDFGEGMDEAVIDGQLTRLFSSTKEGDLTKIGKFGIGFASVFAVAPDLVRVRTGRHGEAWELLFHTDRSYEKNRLDEAVHGTTVTVYKRMRKRDAAKFAVEARQTLLKWCEHATTPIFFLDGTGESEAEPDQEPGDDPFADFAAADESERIDRPLTLDNATLQVAVEVDDIAVVAGYCGAMDFGFYSGGLTLYRGGNAEFLQGNSSLLGNVSFKVRSPRLEHTLTRDSVLMDGAWDEAMNVVKHAASALRARLEERIVEEAAAGSRLSAWHRLLKRDVDAGRTFTSDEAKIFVDQDGVPRRLVEFSGVGVWNTDLVFAPRDPALSTVMADGGWILIADEPGTRELVETLRPGWRTVDAGDLYVMPHLIEVAGLPVAERDLLEAAQTHMDQVTGCRVQLRVGEFGGPGIGRHEPLFVEGPAEEGVFRRPNRSGLVGAIQAGWRRLSSVYSARFFLLNRHHSHYLKLTALGASEPGLAAASLAQALMVQEDWFGDQSFEILRVSASAPWLESDGE